MTRQHTEAVDRYRAIGRAVEAVAALAAIGVSALVTGSLARGTYRSDSDVDLLVTECPRNLKYAIEGVVEDCMGGISFDVIYLDEVPQKKLSRFVNGAQRACDLR